MSLSPRSIRNRKLPIRFEGGHSCASHPVKIRRGIIAKTQRKRVFVLDPSRRSRLALEQWLDRAPDLALCGHAERPARALPAIERLKPDLVVTEILCQQNLDFIRALKRRFPRLPVLVLSLLDGEFHAAEALGAGADGYLAKTADAPNIVAGLREAAAGRIVLSRRVRAQFLAKCLPPMKPAHWNN